MRTWRTVVVGAIVLAAAMDVRAQTGGDYGLTWSSLDCGSTTASVGNGYALRSAIGDTGSGSATGGAYALQGGFRAPTDAPIPDVTDGAGPLVFRLHANSPNPFVHTTAIAFSLPRETAVELRIYDLAGRRVRNVLERRMGPGRHQVIWDGRDDSGRRAAHGIYLLRLQAGELHANRKLALVP